MLIVEKRVALFRSQVYENRLRALSREIDRIVLLANWKKDSRRFVLKSNTIFELYLIVIALQIDTDFATYIFYRILFFFIQILDLQKHLNVKNFRDSKIKCQVFDCFIFEPKICHLFVTHFVVACFDTQKQQDHRQ